MKLIAAAVFTKSRCSFQARKESFCILFLTILFLLLLPACGLVNKLSSTTVNDPASTPIPPARLYDGASVAGAWTPSITGGGAANVKGTVTITTTSSTQVAGMVRLNEAWGSKQVTVDLGTYDATTDFGPNGSISLVADVTNYPYSGGAYPVLSSFYVVETGTGTTYEYVNLTASCANSGMYTCSGGYCDSNTNCKPTVAASGFFSRDDWDQHQVMSFGYTSTNSFPRCDNSIAGWSACPASLSTLKSGHYYARYILLSDRGSSVASTLVGLKVTKIVKKDTTARDDVGLAKNGAVNLNVILVGSQNIGDAHSAKGAQNLNLLFTEVHKILKDNAKVGINSIKVYEWRDADGGSQYSQVEYDDLGVMFAAGSKGVAAADEGKYINVFLVSDIQYAGASFTILGLSGGIHGPPVDGTQSSGLAFSSFNQLAVFNSSVACTLASCARDDQDDDFLEMGATIAHELGHYLGLNHPSERTSVPASQRHDQLGDTPKCAPRNTLGSYTLDQRACYNDLVNTMNASTCRTACDTASGGNYFNAGNNGYVPNSFCPAVAECQFNHIMWYTTKNRKKVGAAWVEDGSLISSESSALVQWNSFVR